jgi:hypothetical protein
MAVMPSAVARRARRMPRNVDLSWRGGFGAGWWLRADVLCAGSGGTAGAEDTRDATHEAFGAC